MTEKLLPCPFCGGEARTFDFNGTAQATCAGDFTECAGADGYSPVAAWNRRTPAPEGEVVAWRYRFVTTTDGKSWSDWKYCEGPPSHAGEWSEVQPLYASPVVPKTADEIKAVVMAWLDADDPASWGDFEKRLNAAVSDEAPPVVPVGVRDAIQRLAVLFEQARNGTPVTDPDPYNAEELEAIIAILAALTGEDAGETE